MNPWYPQCFSPRPLHLPRPSLLIHAKAKHGTPKIYILHWPIFPCFAISGNTSQQKFLGVGCGSCVSAYAPWPSTRYQDPRNLAVFLVLLLLLFLAQPNDPWNDIWFSLHNLNKTRPERLQGWIFVHWSEEDIFPVTGFERWDTNRTCFLSLSYSCSILLYSLFVKAGHSIFVYWLVSNNLFLLSNDILMGSARTEKSNRTPKKATQIQCAPLLTERR